MAIFTVNENRSGSEYSDIKRVRPNDRDYVQYLEVYIVNPVKNYAKLVYEYITGFLFTEDKYMGMFEDGYIDKCNDQ